MHEQPIYQIPRRPPHTRGGLNRRALRLAGLAGILVTASVALGSGIAQTAETTASQPAREAPVPANRRTDTVAALQSRFQPNPESQTSSATDTTTDTDTTADTDTANAETSAAGPMTTLPQPAAAPPAAGAGLTDANGVPIPNWKDGPSAAPPPPAETVIRFYQLLEDGQYEALTPLWSDSRRASMSWNPTALKSRASTGDLTVRRADVTALDERAGYAVVAVDVLEVTGPAPLGHRRYVGTWELVRGPQGWLLDEPNIQVE